MRLFKIVKHPDGSFQIMLNLLKAKIIAMWVAFGLCVVLAFCR